MRLGRYILLAVLSPSMKMFRSLFLLLFMTFAVAKGLHANEQVPDQGQFITAGNYRLFLAAVAEVQDTHGLYQSDMVGQILYENNGAQKNYRIVEGQKDVPMGNMTSIDAMRYCNWKEQGVFSR